MGKIPILTHIFQMGWFNHQLEIFIDDYCQLLFRESIESILWFSPFPRFASLISESHHKSLHNSLTRPGTYFLEDTVALGKIWFPWSKGSENSHPSSSVDVFKFDVGTKSTSSPQDSVLEELHRELEVSNGQKKSPGCWGDILPFVILGCPAGT